MRQSCGQEGKFSQKICNESNNKCAVKNCSKDSCKFTISSNFPKAEASVSRANARFSVSEETVLKALSCKPLVVSHY